MRPTLRFLPLLSVLPLALLSGCSTPPTKLTHTPEFAPVYPVAAAKTQIQSGSIFNQRNSDNWFGRNKTYQVGDVVTVLLNEETQTERKVEADVNRSSSNNVLKESTGLANAIRNLSVGGSKFGGALKDVKLDGAELSNTGGGKDFKKASLYGAVTVTVVEVLENDNLVVRGEKQLALTEGSEIIQLSGIIRPVDISPSNMVQSSRLANAQISYRGTGDLANASKAGWGTSVLMKIWPF